MSGIKERFRFACAPDSWGVLDYPGPSWEQSYELMLDEMVEAGYTGTELGPYGFFPTDPKILQPQLESRKRSEERRVGKERTNGGGRGERGLRTTHRCKHRL